MPNDMTPEEVATYRGLRRAQRLAFETARDAGWHDEPRGFPTAIALMHSELSEALEAHRRDMMDDKLTHRMGVEVELADCLIRILDTAEEMGLDLGAAVVEKNRYNRTRADHKRAARAARGGKAY